LSALGVPEAQMEAVSFGKDLLESIWMCCPWFKMSKLRISYGYKLE
jgi:hypothetical protein